MKRCKDCGKPIPRNRGSGYCTYHYIINHRRKKNALKKIRAGKEKIGEINRD